MSFIQSLETALQTRSSSTFSKHYLHSQRDLSNQDQNSNLSSLLQFPSTQALPQPTNDLNSSSIIIAASVVSTFFFLLFLVASAFFTVRHTRHRRESKKTITTTEIPSPFNQLQPISQLSPILKDSLNQSSNQPTPQTRINSIPSLPEGLLATSSFYSSGCDSVIDPTFPSSQSSNLESLSRTRLAICSQPDLTSSPKESLGNQDPCPSYAPYRPRDGSVALSEISVGNRMPSFDIDRIQIPSPEIELTSEKFKEIDSTQDS